MANFANYGNLETILTGYANKINGISEVVPSNATTSNKLATAEDIPGITISTTDLTPGTSPLTTGDLYFVYEA